MQNPLCWEIQNIVQHSTLVSSTTEKMRNVPMEHRLQNISTITDISFMDNLNKDNDIYLSYLDSYHKYDILPLLFSMSIDIIERQLR